MIDRVDLINEIIIKKKVKSYLEIGVFAGECLFNIKTHNKVAVDPSFSFGIKHKIKNLFKNSNYNIKYHEVTSDKFFEFNTKVFDLIFIDGLHTWEQLFYDIKNSLKFLSPSGVILMHDCLPITKWEALPAKSYDDFKNLKPKDVSPLWCGDGWKILYQIKQQQPEFDLKLIDLDHGIGVIKNKANNLKAINKVTIEKTSSFDYETDFESYKNSIEILSAKAFVESL